MPDLLGSRSLNVVAGAAIALLVVGAGGAVGLGSSGPAHARGALTGSPSTPRPGAVGQPSAGASTTTTTVPSTSTSTSLASVPVGGLGSSSTVGAQASTTTTTATGHTAPTGGAPGSPVPAEPETGTYSYATRGSASVVGQTYTSPATTTIDISPSGCGQADRWNEAPGDSTTIVGCPVSGGVHIVSETTQTTVDGHTSTQTFTCDSDAFVPLGGTPGQVWKWACHSDHNETSEQTVTLDGPETMSVAGTTVATDHVSIVSVLSGPITGHSDTEDWLNDVGLRIKETGNVDASEYGVTFQSNYTIDLDALNPS